MTCFGPFESKAEELRRAAAEQGYAEQLETIVPCEESVGANKLYAVI